MGESVDTMGGEFLGGGMGWMRVDGREGGGEGKALAVGWVLIMKTEDEVGLCVLRGLATKLFGDPTSSTRSTENSGFSSNPAVRTGCIFNRVGRTLSHHKFSGILTDIVMLLCIIISIKHTDNLLTLSSSPSSGGVTLTCTCA